MSRKRFSFKMLAGSILAGAAYGIAGEAAYSYLKQRVSPTLVTALYFTGMYLFIGIVVYLVGRMGHAKADGQVNKKQWAAALDYAKELGLAFQIRDDMLDVESTAEELGKPIGSDADNGKTTFASLYGLEKCAELVSEHTRRAQESIAGVFEHTDFLCALARFMAVRKH